MVSRQQEDVADRKGAEQLRERYCLEPEGDKIDAIVFVCSASDEHELPENLMRDVYEVARPSRNQDGFDRRRSK